MRKEIFILAGPNGAGKTTVAQSLIPNFSLLYEFLNADEIARGLAPFHPESVALAASKLMIKRLKELLVAKKNFAFETTASGTNYLKHLKAAQDEGYIVHLLFLWLSSPSLAIERVARRVKQGGHHIPEETIHRRYYAGLKNLIKFYLPLADTALIVDNSITESRNLIAEKNASGIIIINKVNWEQVERGAYVKS